MCFRSDLLIRSVSMCVCLFCSPQYEWTVRSDYMKAIWSQSGSTKNLIRNGNIAVVHDWLLKKNKIIITFFVCLFVLQRCAVAECAGMDYPVHRGDTMALGLHDRYCAMYVIFPLFVFPVKKFGCMSYSLTRYNLEQWITLPVSAPDYHDSYAWKLIWMLP